MKKFYTDSYEDKVEFVRDVISAMVRQYGFAEARYLGTKEYEFIEIISVTKCGVKVIKSINVTADSCLAMMTDVLINL